MIRVTDLVGKDALTFEDGQKVYDLILAALRRNADVVLDFEGVGAFATPFFNASLGQLVEHYSIDELARRIRSEHLNKIGQDIAKRAIENAKSFYALPNYQEAQRKILEDLAGRS